MVNAGLTHLNLRKEDKKLRRWGAWWIPACKGNEQAYTVYLSTAVNQKNNYRLDIRSYLSGMNSTWGLSLYRVEMITKVHGFRFNVYRLVNAWA